MLVQKKSICITGEVGIGKTYLAQQVVKALGKKCCYGYYRGDNTKCLQQIASSLNISLNQIDNEGAEGKPLTAKQLKEDIAECLGETILICDHFHRWPASLKGWVEDLHESGATILLLGNHRDLEGVTYKIPRLALSPLKDDEIRDIIWRQAKQLSHALTTNEVVQMAGRAGGNPLLAKRMVQELHQGVESTNIQDGNNYRSITPFLMFTAGLIGAVRFVGLATGDIRLRIVGGVFITFLFSFRYLSALFPKRSRK
ncbi:ATPase (plasmid) [Calothrix sp. NIES-4071]|nr:ATPase [Calothrix sp. NIES-4071]BAZ65070.1 ATPase [Calothrix sp. NIES-4105]